MSQYSKQDRALQYYIETKSRQCRLEQYYDRSIEWVNTCICNGCHGQMGLCHKYYKFIMYKQSKKRWKAPFGYTPKGQGMTKPIMR